jgi:hypothetical protein
MKQSTKDNLIITAFVIGQALIIGLHYTDWGILPHIHLVFYFSPTIVLGCYCIYEMISFAMIKDEKPNWIEN